MIFGGDKVKLNVENVAEFLNPTLSAFTILLNHLRVSMPHKLYSAEYFDLQLY